MKLILLLLSFSALAIGQPNAAPMPLPEIQFLDQNGKPLVGAKVCTYAAGTSTPLSTYTDSTATTPNTNPVILDVYGRASIWVRQLAYKVVLRTGGDGTCSTGVVQWSQDQILAIFQQVNQINGLTGNIQLFGTAGQVTITPSGNTLTFSLPQSICSTCNVSFGTISGTSLGLTLGPVTVGGVSVVSTARDINANSYAINSTGIIDSAYNALLHSVKIMGRASPSIDNADNHNANSYSINGFLTISSTRDASFNNVNIGGVCTGCPAGPVSTQSIGGHSFGTVYQNTATTPKYVNVLVTLHGGTPAGNVSALSDAFATPITTVANFGTFGSAGNSGATLSFIVLPNAYYRVVIGGSVDLNGWSEWQ